MFGDLSKYFAMFEGFAKDMFAATIEAAEAEAKSSVANVAKLKKQKAAIERFIAKYRADLAKSAKDAKRAQEKWNKQARKRAKDAIPGMYGGAPLVSAAFPPDRRKD